MRDIGIIVMIGPLGLGLVLLGLSGIEYRRDIKNLQEDTSHLKCIHRDIELIEVMNEHMRLHK